MADFDAGLNPGIQDQAGAASSRYLLQNISTNVTTARVLPSTTIEALLVPASDHLGATSEDTGEGLFSSTVDDYAADFAGTPHEFWFEKVHALPQLIVLGNILSTVTEALEIYNAYREESRTVSSISNSAGAGTSVTGFPATPFVLAAQSGETGQFEATTEGPPTVSGAVTFVLDTITIVISVSGERVVFFPFLPESPIRETLEFRTGILRSSKGKEQRRALRKNPRQIFDMEFIIEEGNARSRMQALLFGWHANVFGIPVWHESRLLQADALIGATTVSIDTDYADFRVGSLAVVWSDDDTWDVLEIASFTSSSITFSSALTYDFTTNQALVMPVRTAITDRTTDLRRQILNLERVSLPWQCLDNDSDLADTSAFNSFNGKVLLDGPNLVGGDGLQDNIDMKRHIIDNRVGVPEQSSLWTNPRYQSQKGFFASNAQQTWEIRQLAHALRGSQVTFYLPTFFHDLVVKADLASGSFNMDIEHIGYTDFINAQAPNNAVWIELNDGTIHSRVISSSSEIDATTERLVVDVAWPSTIAFGDISRVSFLRLCRIADDRVQFEHDGTGESLANFGVMGVQQ